MVEFMSKIQLSTKKLPKICCSISSCWVNKEVSETVCAHVTLVKEHFIYLKEIKAWVTLNVRMMVEKEV